jgi:hypothetical protein
VKRWSKVALGLAVVGCWPLAWRLTGPRVPRFPYAAAGRPTETASLKGFAPWNVEVEPGLSLRGIRREPTSADAGWILFFHGNDSAQLASGASVLSRLAGGADVGLAMVAYRGFDGSPGKPSPAALRADALAIFGALGVDPGRVRLYAFSLGGPLAVHVAAELSRRGTPPSSLTLLAGSSELAMLPQVPWAPLLRGDLYEAGPELAEVRCPVRLFHGLADTTLPVTQAHAMAARLGARGRLTELPGVTHETILTTALPE